HRLDSWKEIAAFFGRDERTVRRWEKERGLPVHRVPGGARSAVFAYTNELADWLKGRSQELDADDSTSEIDEHTIAEQIDEKKPAAPTITLDASSSTARVSSAIKSPTAARVAAWTVPLVLAVGLVTYFSIGHSGPQYKALASRHSANAEAADLYLGPDSIAVLPFTNARGDANTDYLSDGITESLIGNLSHVPQLKVRSRDSVFRYKGKDVEVQTVGRSLGVSVVLTGRVMVQGDSVEISAELTDVRDNTEIWGHRYTGKSANLISLQQQIASDIAGKLRATLSPAARQQVINQGTRDAQAYSLYLKGRYAWNNRTLADLRTAVSYFDQAIAKDPGYALAYSGLADAYSVIPFFGVNPSEFYAKSNAAARRAMESDAGLSHPRPGVGSHEMSNGWDFGGRGEEFKKAPQTDPNDAPAHHWVAEAPSGQEAREHEPL